MFKEEILECEKFNNNKNYVYTKGNKKVIITSVHSMKQYLKNNVKLSEPFTKGIAKYVADKTFCFSYIKLVDTNIDSNAIKIDEYKNNLLNIIKTNDIKLLLDIHVAKEERDFDIELGTLNNLSSDITIIKELIEAFNFEGINNIKINEPFIGKGNVRHIYANTNIDIIQIEINKKFREYNNIENIEKVCKALIFFVNQYNDIISK